MATTSVTAHGIHTGSAFTPQNLSPQALSSKSELAIFVSDLIEDVSQQPLQPAELAKHDIFREHIIAMSVCYFTLIVLMIAASVPALGFLVRNLVNY